MGQGKRPSMQILQSGAIQSKKQERLSRSQRRELSKNRQVANPIGSPKQAIVTMGETCQNIDNDSNSNLSNNSQIKSPFQFKTKPQSKANNADAAVKEFNPAISDQMNAVKSKVQNVLGGFKDKIKRQQELIDKLRLENERLQMENTQLKMTNGVRH